MAQKYFRFPVCFYEAAEKMTIAQRDEFYEALLNYVFLGKVYTMSQTVEAFFWLIRPYLDKEKKRMEGM